MEFVVSSSRSGLAVAGVGSGSGRGGSTRLFSESLWMFLPGSFTALPLVKVARQDPGGGTKGGGYGIGGPSPRPISTGPEGFVHGATVLD